MVNKLLSVSETLDLLTCPRKAWNDRQPIFAWLRTPDSIPQVLGSVLHLIIEEIDSGRFDTIADDVIDSEIAERWKLLVADGHYQLSRQTQLGIVPPAERWPFYVLKCARAIDRAKMRRMHRSSSAVKVSPEIELTLESQRLGIRGRVDRVEFSGDLVRIVDHKSSTRPSGAMPHRYVLQLLIYCLLYESVHGIQPRSAAIEWLGGERESIPVTTELLEDTRNQIETARSHLDSDQVPRGIPSPEVCRFCHYRPVCDQYLESDRYDWAGQPTFLVGSVINTFESSSLVSLNLRVNSSHPGNISTAALHGVLKNIAVREGDTVMADRLSWPRNMTNFDINWETRMRVISQVPPDPGAI